MDEGKINIDFLGLFGVPRNFDQKEIIEFAANAKWMAGYQRTFWLLQCMRMRGVKPPVDEADVLAADNWARAVVARALWAKRRRDRILRRAQQEAEAEFWLVATTPGTVTSRRNKARDDRIEREAKAHVAQVLREAREEAERRVALHQAG